MRKTELIAALDRIEGDPHVVVAWELEATEQGDWVSRGPAMEAHAPAPTWAWDQGSGSWYLGEERPPASAGDTDEDDYPERVIVIR